MRKISPEQQKRIRAAIDMLVAEGNDNPTNDEIREKMGGGSIADISPVARQWRDSRKKDTQVMITMPDSLKQAGERFTAQIWATADGLAQEIIHEAKSELENRLTEVESERDEALEEISKLEGTGNDLAKDIEALKKQLEDQSTFIKERDKQIQSLFIEKEKATVAADTANTRADQLIENLNALQKQNQTLQAELIKIARARGKGDKP